MLLITHDEQQMGDNKMPLKVVENKRENEWMCCNCSEEGESHEPLFDVVTMKKHVVEKHNRKFTSFWDEFEDRYMIFTDNKQQAVLGVT